MKSITGDESVVPDDQLVEQIRENLGKKDWSGCVGCTDCCTMIGYPIELDKFQQELHEAHFGEKKKNATFKIRHTCSKLDPKTKKCTIYEDRPQICRQFYCEASKKRKRVHEIITEEYKKNDQQIDRRTIDIFPYLSKIGVGQGERHQDSELES